MKIHTGDTVIVISGKDRGKTGKVVRALPSLNAVIVEGINMYKRHIRRTKSTRQGGQIVDKTMPIDVSNVMLIDPKDNKPSRVSRKYDEKKKEWVRISRRSGEQF